MAPKRKCTVPQRLTSTRQSSFVDCPACESLWMARVIAARKVIRCLLNNHLDWDCSSLQKNQQEIFDFEDIGNDRRQAQRDVKSKVFSSGHTTSGKEVEDTDSKLCHNREEFFPCLDAEAITFCPKNKAVEDVEACTENAGERDTRESKAEVGSLGCGAAQAKVTDFAEGQSQEIVDNNFGVKETVNAGKAVQSYCSYKSIVEAADIDQGRCHSSSEASVSGSKFVNSAWSFIRPSPPLKAPKGHLLIEDFISPEVEEHHLISLLDMDLKNPWKVTTFNGLQMGKAYGVVMDLRRRMSCPAIFEMPKAVQPILERMRARVPVLKDFWPNEMNSIDYYRDRGHWLKPHVDDRQLSGTVLVNLSLSGECKMTYERERGPREFYKVLLRPRSIQVLTGECRYNFTHSIKNEDLISPHRISMTFRESVLPLAQSRT